MLQDGDFRKFLSLYHEVIAENQERPPVSSSLEAQADGLFPPEIRRLSQSVAIASELGDAPPQAKLVIDGIWRSLDGDGRYASLDNEKAWKQVIRHGMKQVGAPDNGEKIGGETIVGHACLRLRNKGYNVEVSAYGVRLDRNSQHRIFQTIDAHIASLGGFQCLKQICHMFRTANRIHDGMWLFGDRVPGLFQLPMPEVPIGWLFSLSVKHLGRNGSASNPEAEWASVVELATDFAATIECQRYSQFEQMSVHACEFWPILAKSLAWRELFSLPQVPPMVLHTLVQAFDEAGWPKNFLAAKREIVAMMNEILQLEFYALADEPSTFKRTDIKNSCPQLWKLARKKAREANKGYLSPFSMNRRNQDSTVIFELNSDRVLILPKPMMLASACDALFRHIWKILGDAAEKLVGNVIEKCVALNCWGNADTVVESETYYVGKQDFEIDVGARTKDQIVLFEIKAKSLTSNARAGDMFAFLKDYTESYLHMLLQLFRNERHIRNGFTSLAEENEPHLRVTKVAVSPLSFGSASDHALSNALLGSLAYAKMYPVEQTPQKIKIMKELNDAVARLMAEVEAQIPPDATEINLHSIFFDVFWFDLGQLLYAMHRAGAVKDALRPLRHVTFSTRDFWTEVSLLDAQELTKKYWNDVRAH